MTVVCELAFVFVMFIVLFKIFIYTATAATFLLL